MTRAHLSLHLPGGTLTISLGWLLIVLAIAGATVQALAPSSMHLSGAILWYTTGTLLIAGFFGSLVLHELSHLKVAQVVGYSARRIGLYPFGGVSEGYDDPGTPRQIVLVALAGPIASGLAAAVFAILWWASPESASSIRRIFAVLAIVNGCLGAVNLLPAYPLDGGRIFRALVWYLHDDFNTATRAAVAYSQIVSVFTLATGLVLLATEPRRAVWGLWIVISAWCLSRLARDERTRAFFVIAGSKLTAAETVEGMNPRAEADQSLDEVIELMLANEQNGPTLVWEDGKVIGLISFRQLRSHRRADWNRLTAREVMVSLDGLQRIDESATVRDLLGWLAEHEHDTLLVTRQGEVIGAVDRRLAVGRLLDRSRARQRLTRPE
ncbi:MAG TPA: site-2 protease family protein [Thermomicrobiaceae bacterium]|nr:site-2 protease family protein [Thermomicrobiaceae bacterium]